MTENTDDNNVRQAPTRGLNRLGALTGFMLLPLGAGFNDTPQRDPPTPDSEPEPADPERVIKQRRYAFLTGYAARYDHEEAELQELRVLFVGAPDDPEWDVVPRDPLFVGSAVTVTEQIWAEHRASLRRLQRERRKQRTARKHRRGWA